MSPGQAILGLYDSLLRPDESNSSKILEDKHYDRSSNGLSHFLSKLYRHANYAGWGKIAKTKGHDIFHKYGLLTIQNARKEAKTRFQFDAAGNQTITREA